MSSKRQGRKRLSVDIPEALHNDIQFCADTRNITITRWVIRACYARLKEEKTLEPYIKDQNENS